MSFTNNIKNYKNHLLVIMNDLYFHYFLEPIFVLDEVRFFAIFKPECDIFQKVFLVSFDGKMIVGMTLSDQVLRDLALGQQCIGSHILALNINGIKQGDSHFDLVRAFGIFMVLYRQGTHFFWA